MERKKREDYAWVKRFCVICQKEIPTDRRKDAVTCSPPCQKIRVGWVRAQADKEFCRYCRKPSTAEQRASFQRWKKWEKQQNAEAEMDLHGEDEAAILS